MERPEAFVCYLQSPLSHSIELVVGVFDGADDWMTMIRAVNGKLYEFTLGSYAKLLILQSWFPRRRFLRLCRRVAVRAASWLPVLIIFIPLASLVLMSFVHAGGVTFNEACFEFASIFLSSVVLLFIKDNLDAESDRGKKLRYQHELYLQILSQLCTAYRDLCKSVGVKPVEWHAYLSSVELKSYLINEIVPANILVDSDSLVLFLKEFESCFDRIDNQIASADLLDWDALPSGRGAINDARSCVSAIERLSRFDETELDNQKLATEMESLLRSEYQLLAALRRPWRYPVDVSRRAMVSNFVLENGIKVEG